MEIIHKIKNKYNLNYFLIFFFIYCLVRLFYISIPILNADENWFIFNMDKSLKTQLTLSLAYSPFFWVFGHIIIKTFSIINNEIAVFVLRFFYIACYALSIFLLYKIILKKTQNNFLSQLVGIFLFSLPISFYSDKIITPEFLQLILLTYSLILIIENKFLKSAWFLAGFSVGLKLHTLHFLIFLFFIEFYFAKERNLKQFIYFAKIAFIFSLLGIILANFPILINTKNSLISLNQAAGNRVISSQWLYYVIYDFFFRDPELFWDCIIHPFSNADMLIPTYPIILTILLFLSIKNKNLLFSLFLILYFFSALIFTSLGHYSFIWFHISYLPIILSTIFFLKLPTNNYEQKFIICLLIIGISINLVYSYKIVKKKYRF